MMKKYFLVIAVAFAFSLTSVAQKTDTIKVKVHNHVMTLYASGAGTPAVIMEAGLGASHKAWDSVQLKIAKFTNVVSYDRPGYLNSDTCSSPRDAITVAKELREALTKAGIKPSYILAGWSLGGAFVRVFAGLYSIDIAGLVLVDPAPEESYARFDKEFPELMAEDAKYVQEIMRSKTRIGEREEIRFYDSSMNQARRSDAKHSTPTYLLIAAGKAPGGQDRDPSNPLNKIWIEELEKWAKKRPNLKYEIISNSGHHVARYQPDTVVHAIRDVVTQWQMKQLKQSASAYKKPVQLNDGIQTTTLKDAGIDEKMIRAMTDSIVNGNYPNIHSVLILHNNKLVYENYFPGIDVTRGVGFVGFKDHHRDSLHDIRSVTKSVTGAAVLIAHAQGKIKSLNQRVFDFFPEYEKHDTGMKKQITIQHLLNMSAGLEWDEEISYADPRNSEVRMNNSPDAIEFVLSQKLVDTPGKKYNYSGGCTQVLAAIIEKATGMPVDKFTEEHLFKPLAIQKYTWVKNREGNPSAASGLRMRSRDMAKFGLLFLNNGKWNGKQIVPSLFVSQTLTSQATAPYKWTNLIKAGYSNQFWVYTEIFHGSPITYAQCQGNGGQIIVIDKQRNLVLLITAGNYNRSDLRKSSFDIYPDFVFPAVTKPATSYKKPVQLNDGILTATLKDVGIDKTIINSMTDSIIAGVYPNIHSVLILRDNKLVYEQYWPGNDEIRGKGYVGFVDHHRDSFHDQRSVTKSVVSAAVMIAIDQRKIKNVDQQVFDFFPEYVKHATGLKKQITIKQLLTMSAGLEWNETVTYDDPSNSEISMYNSPDPIEYVLIQKLLDTPGKKFNYSGGCTQILAAIVERATGIAIDKFTEKFLFKPLGISEYDWLKTNNAVPIAASGLRLRSRDMAKLGLLYMNDGKYLNKQVILPKLVNESLQMHINSDSKNGYGYQFWLWFDTVLKQPVTTVQAGGNGGQRIAINTQLNVVTIITAGNYNAEGKLKKKSDNLYLDFIYPAVTKAATSSQPIEIIKSLTHKAFEAVFKQDTATISAMMDENFISIYPNKINNKQQELSGIYKYIKQMKSEGQLFDSFTLDDFRVRLHDNTAVATYYSNSKGRNKGASIESRMQWYDVWMKRNGNWKMIASQGTSISK